MLSDTIECWKKMSLPFWTINHHYITALHYTIHYTFIKTQQILQNHRFHSHLDSQVSDGKSE